MRLRPRSSLGDRESAGLRDSRHIHMWTMRSTTVSSAKVTSRGLRCSEEAGEGQIRLYSTAISCSRREERLVCDVVGFVRSNARAPWSPRFYLDPESSPSQLITQEMGANQSKIFRRRRGRDRSRVPRDTRSTPANTAREIGIENQNSIVNTVTGDIVKIVNSNPATNNVITNNYAAAPAPEASVRYVYVV